MNQVTVTPARLRLSGLAACITVAAALSGCAASNPFQSNNNFDQTFIGAAQTWDLDKNSTVTCQEWQTYVGTLIREHDSNGDNVLSAAEYQAMSKTDKLFEFTGMKYYDANSDGSVNFNEIAGKPNRAFALLDKNGDCSIDRNESVRVHGVAPQKAGPSRAPPGQSTPGPRGR